MSLLDRALAGDVAATSRLISAVEGRRAGVHDLLADVHRLGGRAQILGVTGAPGTGKSTLVAALTREVRRRDRTVAVVAVDPSSALSGGAILGDRIRMHEHAVDDGVFVRSMSTRGTLGGLSRATVDAVAVLDAAGWDLVIIETVGVGQSEIDVVRLAHTTVVVSVPGTGDGVQAIKAGLLEVADLHVVNKADRADANRTAAELVSMLTLAGVSGADRWAVPVLSTIALDGTGVPALADSVDAHMEWMSGSGELGRRELTMAAHRIRALARELFAERLARPADERLMDELTAEVAARRLDPHTAASALVDPAARVEQVV